MDAAAEGALFPAAGGLAWPVATPAATKRNRNENTRTRETPEFADIGTLPSTPEPATPTIGKHHRIHGRRRELRTTLQNIVLMNLFTIDHRPAVAEGFCGLDRSTLRGPGLPPAEQQ
jgi:hypothetical protein